MGGCFQAAGVQHSLQPAGCCSLNTVTDTICSLNTVTDTVYLQSLLSALVLTQLLLWLIRR